MIVSTIRSQTPVEADEVGTLAKLMSHRDELVNPTIAKDHGRSMLGEFASAVDAV